MSLRIFAELLKIVPVLLKRFEEFLVILANYTNMLKYFW